MKISFDKTKLAAILLLSALIITTPILLTNAHTPPWNIPTYAFVTAAPDTIGIGDYTLIVMWLDKYPVTAGGLGGDRWRGFTLDITKPDGTKVQLPYNGTTSQVGSAYIVYTPDQVGDYTIVFSWPGQTLTNGTGVPNNAGIPFVGDFFEGATSEPAILHVQQTPIAQWVEPQIPNYWTRPIPTANRNWDVLASNWLGGNWLRYSGFQESGQAPNSAHILYAKPIINGGIADQRYGAVKYDTTDYENFFPSPVVMSGKIFYNAGTYPNYGYYCVDLRTGETIWYKNGTDNGLNNPVTYYDNGGGGNFGPFLAQNFPQISFGQLYHYYSVNGEGIKDHLWLTNTNDPQSQWFMIDANTGNWVLTLIHVPGGTTITDQDGSIVRYSYNANTGQFLAWNVSQSIPPPGPTGTDQQQWEPRIGATIDAVNDTSWTQYGPRAGNFASGGWDESDILPRSGYTMNLTGPIGLPTTMKVLQDENYVPRLMFFTALPGLTGLPGGTNDQTYGAALVRIDYDGPYTPYPDKTFTQNNNLGYAVTLLWNKTFTYPLGGNKTFGFGPVSYEDKVFTLACKETRQWWGYSLDDGSLLWGPTDPQHPWDMYDLGSFTGAINTPIAYGKLFSGGYGGILNAYDIKTGELLWNYTLSGIGHESPYGDYQISYVGVADGKVFLYSSEHSPTQPLWRGSYLRAINATDGTEVWKALNFVSGAAIADGCVVAGNMYDNQMYVYGKGPSATSVTIQDDVIPLGSTALIKGAVTDQSPGAPGSPAISDADQEKWMEYLYMKQTMPTDLQGVTVRLTAIDPNGNFQDIGTVTSDSSGLYKKLWTPPIEGEYTVRASFDGSESYGSSSATTAFGVTPATPAAVISPTPTPTASPSAISSPTPIQSGSALPSPTGAVQPPGNETPVTTYIAIAIAVIIIVAAAAAIILRRRK